MKIPAVAIAAAVSGSGHGQTAENFWRSKISMWWERYERELLEVEATPKPRLMGHVARLRERLREQIDHLFPDSPQAASVTPLAGPIANKRRGGLRADVLKVGHNGSKNSTMPEFLAAVSPQIGIISAGEQNPYGHPSVELLDRLKESGVRILRTDEVGAI